MRPCHILLASCILLAVNQQHLSRSRGGGVAAQSILTEQLVNTTDFGGTDESVSVPSIDEQTGNSLGNFTPANVSSTNSHPVEKSPNPEQPPSSKELHIEELSSEDQIVSVCLMCVSTLGVVGNSLIISVWSKAKTFNSTTFVLTFLAISDLIFDISMNILHFFFFFLAQPTYELEWAWVVVTYVTYVCQYASVYCTLLASTTRYLAIKFPLQVHIWFKKSRIRLICGFIFVASLFSAAPASTVGCMFIQYTINLVNDVGYDGAQVNNGTLDVNTTNIHNISLLVATSLSTNITGMNTDLNTPNPSSFFLPNASAQEGTASPVGSDLYSGYQDYPDYGDSGKTVEVCSVLSERAQVVMVFISWALLNIIPWFIIVPMNFLLLHQVRKSFSKRKKALSKDEGDSVALDLMIVFVTSLSILSYPILFIIVVLTNNEDSNYLMGVDAPLALSTQNSYYMILTNDTLVVINSSINFLSYYVCGKGFRRTLHREVLCSFKSKAQMHEKTLSTSGGKSTTRNQNDERKEENSTTGK